LQKQILCSDAAGVSEELKPVYHKWVALCSSDSVLMDTCVTVCVEKWAKRPPYYQPDQTYGALSDSEFDSSFIDLSRDMLGHFDKYIGNIAGDFDVFTEVLHRNAPFSPADYRNLHEGMNELLVFKVGCDYSFGVLKLWGVTHEPFEQFHLKFMKNYKVVAAKFVCQDPLVTKPFCISPYTNE